MSQGWSDGVAQQWGWCSFEGINPPPGHGFTLWALFLGHKPPFFETTLPTRGGGSTTRSPTQNLAKIGRNPLKKSYSRPLDGPKLIHGTPHPHTLENPLHSGVK